LGASVFRYGFSLIFLTLLMLVLAGFAVEGQQASILVESDVFVGELVRVEVSGLQEGATYSPVVCWLVLLVLMCRGLTAL